MKIRNKIISFFAIIIIVFGMLGLVPCAVLIYFTGKINLTNPGSTYIVDSLSSSVKSVNVLLDNSSEALTNVAGTVQEAQDSLKDASGMFKSSSIALAEVADVIEFEILGIKPLDGMSKYFSTMSEDAEKLSQSIFGG